MVNTLGCVADENGGDVAASVRGHGRVRGSGRAPQVCPVLCPPPRLHLVSLTRSWDTAKTPEITPPTDVVLRETVGLKRGPAQLLTEGLLVRVQPEEQSFEALTETPRLDCS